MTNAFGDKLSKSKRLEMLYDRIKRANGISLKALCAEFGVSAKTLQRDFKDLQTLGAYKNGRLIFIDKTRAKDGLNTDERVVVGILDKLARSMSKEFYLKAKPLLTRLTQQIDQPIFINAQSESLNDEDLLKFELLESLINRKEEAKFLYKGRIFEVKPFKLANFQGFWYLLSLDIMDNECFKKFYFKDIKETQGLGRTFTLGDELEKRLKNANSVWFNMDEPFLVQLLIEKKIAKYFSRRTLRGAMIYPQQNGDIVLELEISDYMEIKPLIYEYIPHIRVIEPSWINEKLKKELKKFVDTL